MHAMCDIFTQNYPYHTGKIFINPCASGIFAEKAPFKTSRAVLVLSLPGQKEQRFCVLNVAEELTGDLFQLLLQLKMRRYLEM